MDGPTASGAAARGFRRMTIDAVVVLETMWDWRSMTSEAGYREAPDFFYINPENHSGRRLHKLFGSYRFVVCNACSQLVGGPSEHGTPNPERLARILQKLTRLDYRLLLLCGKVAQQTFSRCGYRPSPCTILGMKHPAARTWTKDEIEQWQKKIQKVLVMAGAK